ncbi:MAG: DUF4160 domain-containing protein [Cyanobacteria bacterium P01_D01_bin.1]
MAEVFRIDGFKVVIFSDDHNPPHVHVRKGEFEVKINIAGEQAELMIGEENNRRAADRRLRKQAVKIANDNLVRLMDEWRRIDAERR